MDESFISSSELLAFYGLIGTIISFIVCLISTFVECSGDYFKDYICPVSYTNDEDNSNIKYFDNFILYFKTLNGEINNKINDILGLEIIYEIIVLVIGTGFFLFYKLYFMKVIQDLSPGHAIFSYSINKIIPKIILPIITLCFERSYFSKNKEDNIKVKYSLGFINNIFATIEFAIYLEMLILHFCGLDHDITENIRERGDKDRINSELAQGINDDNASEEDEENNGVV